MLFYYNFLTVLLMRIGMLKGINFNSVLNIYSTGKNLILSFALEILISCNWGTAAACVGIHFRCVLAMSLVRMRRNYVNCAPV